MDGYLEALRPVKDVDSHEDIKYPFFFSRILFNLSLQFSSKKCIISKIYVDVCLLWLEWESHLHRGNVSRARLCASGFHLLSCFRETLNRSLRHMGVYLHVFWLFQPPGTPPPPAWRRKDHKHGRSFSLAIFVLWLSKASVTNCEYHNQTCTIQHLFYVSVCNQLCSLHLLRPKC